MERRHSYCLRSAVLLLLVALAGSACGRGSRANDSPAPANVQVQLRGCVQPGDEANTFILRLADGGPIDQPGGAANPAASADANGGQSAALGRSGGEPVGTSTTGGDPWPGTRAYQLLAPAGVDLARLIGSWVDVRGELSGSRSAVKGGTDQEQARRGEPYRAVRATAVDVRSGRCPAAAARR